ADRTVSVPGPAMPGRLGERRDPTTTVAAGGDPPLRPPVSPTAAGLPYGRRSPLRLRGLLGWRSADTRTLLVHDTRLVAARVVHGTRLPGSAAGPRRAAHMTVPPHAGRRTTAQGCAATVSAGARCRRASRRWRGRAAR